MPGQDDAPVVRQRLLQLRTFRAAAAQVVGAALSHMHAQLRGRPLAALMADMQVTHPTRMTLSMANLRKPL